MTGNPTGPAMEVGGASGIGDASTPVAGRGWPQPIGYNVEVTTTVDYLELAGDLLRHVRQSSRLTQAEVGQRAGVPQSLISAYETHQKQPTVPTLCRLLGAAGGEPNFWVRIPSDSTTSPYAPMTVADLASRIAAREDGEGGWRWIWEFCEEWRHEPLAIQRALVADEPPSTGDERLDVTLAALVELLATQDGVDPPSWVRNRSLPEPWYPYARSEPAKRLARDEAAPAFRTRNVMIEASTFGPT